MPDQLDSNQESVDNNDKKEEMISYDVHRKLLSQRKKDQEQMTKLNEKLSIYEKRIKDLENPSDGNVDYKKMLETRNNELERLENALKEKDEMIRDYQDKQTRLIKLTAFNNELPAKLKRPEYYAHVDLEKIPLDPDTGEIDKKALSQYTKSFTEDFKDLLDFKTGGNLPNTKTGGRSTLSYEEWLKLSPAEMKRRQHEVVE